MKRFAVVIVVIVLVFFASVVSPVYAYNQADLETLQNTGSCTGCDLSEAQLKEVHLKRANLQGADLEQAKL